MKRVAILYGMAEGPALTTRLRPALRAAGYTLTNDVASADCIITHSGGVLELPINAHNKTVLVVAPSTGYDSSMLVAARRKFWRDMTHLWKHGSGLFWLRKTCINLWYVANVPRTIAIIRKAHEAGRTLPACNAKKVAVVTIAQDSWSRALPREVAQAHSTYAYMTVPGQHDDLWPYPDAYVKLLTIFSEQS